jgi:phosphomannomutase
MQSDFLEPAKLWAAQDPDPVTKAELLELIEANDHSALQARMGSRLEFGTAGLRGELGAGSNRMNRVLVTQTAAGLAEFVLENFPKDPLVVIGFDGRTNSDIFAKDSAEVFAAVGIRTLLFDGVVPTPVLAFTGRNLKASASVMVTASHNPPRDNGYKVYLGGKDGGSQIVSPTDSKIAEKILSVANNKTFDQIAKSSDYEVIGDEMRNKYITATAGITGKIANDNPLKIVYTAMHGVGWATVKKVFEQANLAKPITVDAQLLPDGNFPTVAFPNPEEPGAMDLSFQLAKEAKADLIFANDPDADRLAVGVPDELANGGWRRLTGDELGLLLGHEVARRAHQQDKKGTIACSIVSSSALAKVAQEFGFGYQETLTGFKYIAKIPNLIFGFEEALGYCVDPENTPDKDGISAALVVAALATELAAQGKTLLDQLAILSDHFGHYATGQISIRVTDLSLIAKQMKVLRENPPTEFDGVSAKFTDLNIATANLGSTDALRFDLADSRRVIIRPSGTEPKLKCYLQAIGQTKEAAVESLAALNQAMSQLIK